MKIHLKNFSLSSVKELKARRRKSVATDCDVNIYAKAVLHLDESIFCFAIPLSDFASPFLLVFIVVLENELMKYFVFRKHILIIKQENDGEH